MYKLIKVILFRFSAERIHDIVARVLIILQRIPLSDKIIKLFFRYQNPSLEKEVFGIKFPNPVGLAAGFDKNGEIYNALSYFGFGFIEIGSVTPLEQPGNPKPRCFRIVEDNAIVNRMGINNKGTKYTAAHIKAMKPKVIIGGNISKGVNTQLEDVPHDYEKAFAHLYDFVDYFVINVSCPNVTGLTALQNNEHLSKIAEKLTALRQYYDNYRPILLKVSPDLSHNQIDQIIKVVLSYGLDGIVATNTTTSREGLSISTDSIESIGNGGLSGSPLFSKSLETVKYIHQRTEGIIPIIGVGGIMTPKQAKEMLDAGASLVQIYTGFIYNGPGFVKKILKYLVKFNDTSDNLYNR